MICIGPAEFGRIEAGADAEQQAERLAAPAVDTETADEAPTHPPAGTEVPKRRGGLR